jgi:hypothetical protein
MHREILLSHGNNQGWAVPLPIVLLAPLLPHRNVRMFPFRAIDRLAASPIPGRGLALSIGA